MQVNASKSSASVSRHSSYDYQYESQQDSCPSKCFWLLGEEVSLPSEDIGSQKALTQHCQCPFCDCAHLCLALMSTFGDMADMINFVWAFCEKLCLGSNMLKLISYKTIFCIMAHVWTGYFHLGLISMKETSTQHTMDPLVVRGKCPWMVLPSSIHTSDWKCRFPLKKTSISSLLKRFKKKVFFLGDLLKWGDLLSCLPSACTKIKKAAVPWHYSSFLGLFSFQYNEQGLREGAAKREEFTFTIYMPCCLHCLLSL